MISRRLQKLAEPKITYEEYQEKNNPLPNVYADQNPIWPISKAALNYVPTRRILDLSIPSRKHSQKDFLNLDENGDPTPVRFITEAIKLAPCSQRIEELAKPVKQTKKFDSELIYTESKMHIPTHVLRAVASPRLVALATPKQLPNEYYIQNGPKKLKNGSAPTRVSSRIIQLATPSMRSPFQTQEKFEKELRQRLLNATKYRTKSYDYKLAQPVRLPDSYVPNRTFSEVALVARKAKHYDLTERILDLAVPRPRRLDVWEQEFNPNAFIISSAALNAIANDRINQLSKPISR